MYRYYRYYLFGSSKVVLYILVARKLLEISTAIFGILSYIILEKTEDYENFRTNNGTRSSLRRKNNYLEISG